MLSNKVLIALSGISPRTYYRRIKTLKQSGDYIKKTKGSLLSVDEAQAIAKNLCFTYKLEKFLLGK